MLKRMKTNSRFILVVLVLLATVVTFASVMMPAEAYADPMFMAGTASDGVCTCPVLKGDCGCKINPPPF